MQNIFYPPTSGDEAFRAMRRVREQQRSCSAGSSSPLAKEESESAQAAELRIKRAAVILTLQRAGRGMLARYDLSNELPISWKISKLLTPLASRIPATPGQIKEASEFLSRDLSKSEMTPNSPVPGLQFARVLSTNSETGLRSFLIPLKRLHPEPKQGEQEVTEGTYKVADGSVLISCSPHSRTFSAEQKALISIKSDESWMVSQVARGIKNIESLILAAKEQGVSIYVTPPGEKLEKRIYLQNWAHSSLLRAIMKSSVDSSFNPTSEPRPFKRSSLNALECALRVAETLDFFHKNHFAHRDVKSANILLTYDKETKKFDASVTDFDFLNHFGWDPEADPDIYDYWDPLALCNITASTADAHGMLIIIRNIYLGAINLEPIRQIRNEIMETMILGKTPNLSCKDIDRNFELCFKYLLKLVCYQSMLILISILGEERVKNLPVQFRRMRGIKEYAHFSDFELCYSILKHETSKNHKLFTKEAVIKATTEAEERMEKENIAPCTMPALIDWLKRRIEKHALKTTNASKSSAATAAASSS